MEEKKSILANMWKVVNYSQYVHWYGGSPKEVYEVSDVGWNTSLHKVIHWFVHSYV